MNKKIRLLKKELKTENKKMTMRTPDATAYIIMITNDDSELRDKNHRLNGLVMGQNWQ